MTGHWRKPLEFSDEAMTAASVQVESLRNALRGTTRSAGDWDELAAVLDDDFNTPAALAIFHRWAREGALTSCDAGSPSSGSESSPTPSRRRPRSSRWPVPAPGHEPHGLHRVGSPARRDRGRRLGGAGRTERPKASSSCRCGDTGAHLRPKRGPGGIARPPRGARALGLRAGRRLARLARRRPSASDTKERELTEAAGSPDHQGVIAWAGPYPYADPWELAAGKVPLLACLDQVTDPRNLGAVIRSAAGAGATGVIVPAHGAAQVTPAVCRVVGRHGRAPAGGRRPEPGPLPRRDQARRPLVVRGNGGRSPDDVAGRPHRRRRPRLRGRGQGSASPRAQDLRLRDLDPARGGDRVPERQRGGRGAAVRGAEAAEPGRSPHAGCRPSRCPSRRSICSTATTSFTPAADRCARARGRARQLRRHERRAWCRRLRRRR